MTSDDINRLVGAFPADCADAVGAVATIIPMSSAASPTANDIGPITLNGAPIRVPHRIYWPEIGDDPGCSARERLILAAIYSRHHDGFVRERALRRILSAREPFLYPFIVQLLGEYVLEIVDAIEVGISDPIPAEMLLFAEQNPAFFELTRARATSYWNAYARAKFPRLRDYPAHRVLERIKLSMSRRSHPGAVQMNEADETELERLVGLLQACDAGSTANAPTREALRKAALALRLAFLRGGRAEIEEMYAGIGQPLSEEQRQQLRKMGIEPPHDE